MPQHHFALFETAVGRCGISWGASGITSVALPGAGDSDTQARLLSRSPAATPADRPPKEVRQAIERIVGLLGGEAHDLSGISLDMTGVPPFHRKVYEAARDLAPGSTLSYGEIARQLGQPGSARAVGQALGKNPFAIVVPCHRVLAASGKIGGFTAEGGIDTKKRLLAIEQQAQKRPLFTGEAQFPFDPAVAVEHLRKKDRKLARLIDRVGPFAMRLQSTSTIFNALAEAIVHQQLTGKAAATIFGRVRALFPEGSAGLVPEQILAIPPETLKGAGLSNSKMLALRDLAQKTVDGALPTLEDIRAMDEDTIIERLTAVRGIGRWTAEMLLMFRLGRPDVLPSDDYGVRKGFGIVFNKGEMVTPKELQAYGTRWKPYRTVASWYLWRAIDLAKKG